jgi:glycosyltransferase involved in cell wall biosynthesis
MNELVSIVIPVFNRADLLKHTIESILQQTHQNWECILVDDGSFENEKIIIKELIENEPKFIFLNRPDNKRKGPSSCRNYGILNAKGNYTIFLDSDDLLDKNCLKNRLEFAHINQLVDFWVFKMKTFETSINDDLQIINTFSGSDDESIYYENEFLKGKFPFVVTCPLWKTQSLRDLNGFDENLSMLEDPDLNLRAFKNGMISKTALEYNPDCFYRIERKSVHRKEQIKYYNSIILKSNLYFFKKHFLPKNKSVIFNFYRIYNTLVFEKKSLKYANKLNSFGKKHQILSLRKRILVYILLIYRFLEMDKLGGVGYITLKMKFNN